MDRVLFIGPHPDNESIGCGGTLRRDIVGGDEVRVIFLTSGERSGHGRATDETIELREREALNAAKILDRPNSRDSRMGHWPPAPLVARLVHTIQQLRPGVMNASHPHGYTTTTDPRPRWSLRHWRRSMEPRAPLF